MNPAAEGSGDANESSPEQDASIPTAIVETDTGIWHRLFGDYGTRLWWITLFCLLASVVLFITSSAMEGPSLRISFEEGHSIKEGDALQHRGIHVGRVSAVEIAANLSGVVVHVNLNPEAAGLAREGSRFWIERPQLSLSRISGLDTVLGAKFLRVLPGPDDAPPRREFRGIENPLVHMDEDGIDIRIHFESGHGLSVGNSVDFRGIEVGEVTFVELDDALDSVNVGVRLLSGARKLARSGTRFWIEHPQISLSGVSGLDTLIGGRYIAISPGPDDGIPQLQFEGLGSAPPVAQLRGGLEIVLESPRQNNLKRGVPVTYRGIAVGHIVSVGLSTDGLNVKARAYIEPAYKSLVREETRFWSASGFDINVGLSGIKLAADSLAALARGGVAFATPSTHSAVVKTGRRFVLSDKPEDEWLAWSPRIPIGSALLPSGLSLPRMMRATVEWRESTLGIKQTERRHGWLVPLASGAVLGPRNLLVSAPDAVGGKATLELDGREFALEAATDTDSPPLAIRTISTDADWGNKPWPRSRVRVTQEPEDCIIVGDPQSEVIPLAPGRIHVKGDLWVVDRAAAVLGTGWHGASVISRKDGKLIGILSVGTKNRAIIRMSAELLSDQE